MQAHTSAQADQAQLDALGGGCGLIRWDKATVIEHVGPDALDLLHRLTTKELLTVGINGARRTVLTSDRGRVVDVFLIARLDQDRLWLISDSTESERTVSAIDYYTIIEDAELTNLSESHARLLIVGPTAYEAVTSAFGVSIEDGASISTTISGVSVVIAADDSRAVRWVDVICGASDTSEVAEAIVNAGAVAIDSENFEHFRIDQMMPGSDLEYGEHSNPIESGLLSLIDFDKGCYVGQEVIARLDAYDKVQRNVRVLMSSTAPSSGSKLTQGGTPAGVVTSVSRRSTAAGEFLSLALVRRAFLDSGTILSADSVEVTVR